MKYLINRKTKEHRIAGDDWADTDHWKVVEADSEGWIAHTGNECPLPHNHLHEIKYRDESVRRCDEPQLWDWYKDGTQSDITHYRPILEPEKVKEHEPALPADCIETPDLLDRLKAAHKAAQAIPDLEAELREVLAGMGYDLVRRSPFAEPAPAVDPDMTDWRNWREGDLVDVVGEGWPNLYRGEPLRIVDIDQSGFTINNSISNVRIVLYKNDFRFHSRPAKGEK